MVMKRKKRERERLKGREGETAIGDWEKFETRQNNRRERRNKMQFETIKDTLHRHTE